jgi:nucleotide-binding universal stress UspA family protein
MSRPLIVIEDAARDRNLLERARAFAVGDGTDAVVLALATREEYDEIAETLDAIGRAEHTTYDEDDVLEGISGDVEDLADDVLGGDVGYDLRTEIVDESGQADTVVDVAGRTGCDHVFVPGRRRTPTGKAVFGDRTQRIILDFDGYVTVSMN